MKFLYNKYLAALVFMQVAFFSLFDKMAFAEIKKLSKAGNQLITDMGAFSKAVLWGGMVVGIALIITGAVKLTKREGEGGVGPALKFIIAGVIAVGIPALVAILGGSLFDNSDSMAKDNVGGVTNINRTNTTGITGN